MTKEKPKGKLTILEAVDNLSSLAELDNLPSWDEEQRINWTDETQRAKNQETVKESFLALNNYLTHIYRKERGQLKEAETQRGIQAMMVLAGEAAAKLDKYTSLFKGAHGGGVTSIQEYQDLQKFYTTNMLRRFQAFLESEAAWEEEFEGAPEAMEPERRGLKDLETVRRDREYELFFIKKEDGSPFFNRSIVRHIRLLGEFEEGVYEPGVAENPLLKLEPIIDRNLQLSAQEILKTAEHQIAAFYKEWSRHRERPLVLLLHNAVMALLLAANGRNLMQNSTGKSCGEYFADFQRFLREALGLEEYRKQQAHLGEGLSGFEARLVHLAHMLGFAFFLRQEKRGEAIFYLQRLIKTGGGETLHELHHEPLALWHSLLEEDESIRTLLKEYPSGPFIKALEVFKERIAGTGFDPASRGNYPCQLYTLSNTKSHVTMLRLPSPTLQEYIKTAEVSREFEAFLRYVKGRGQKVFLVNLQDRTSWKEYARSVCLERLSMKEEFAETLVVVTLPKASDFYMQRADYETLSDATAFQQAFKEQIEGFEECGYYLPSFMRTKELTLYIDELLQKVHHFFFMDKKTLSHKNRLDFIEIFYQFFILKMVEWIGPDLMSFTCKDGVDTSAAASSSFLGFMRMMQDKSIFSAEEKDFLMWNFFYAALTQRARAIEVQCFNRSISCLAHIHTTLDNHPEALHDTQGFQVNLG